MREIEFKMERPGLVEAGQIVEITEHEALSGSSYIIEPAVAMSACYKGRDRLKSPVERYIYIKTPAEPGWPKSGLLALADISMVGADEHDGAAAICKKDSAGIPTDAIISKREFEDSGGITRIKDNIEKR